MVCHCSKNRNRLALLADRSLDEDLPEDIKRSLANCPTCREHYDHLCKAMGYLQEAQVEGVALLEKSLWPDLTHRLLKPQALPPRYSQWKQQLAPIFSVTAACLALLIVFSTDRSPENRVYQTALNRSAHSLPIPSLSVDYSQAPPYQVLAAPGTQFDPLMDQSFYLRQNSHFLQRATPGTAHDFSYPLELQVEDFLEMQRRLEALE